MLNERTVIIVGAGASFEYELPLGYALKNNIAKLVNFKFDDWGERLVSGDKTLWRNIELYCKQHQISNRNIVREAGIRISNSMPQADSIDEFVETSNNEHIKYVAKLAITKSILDAEKKSLLWSVGNETSNYDINFNKIGSTWLPKLFSKIRKNHTANNLQDLFKNLSIITYNYDRTIEHYFLCAIKNLWPLADEEALEVVEKLQIFHPYGKVGELFHTSTSQTNIKCTPFGSQSEDLNKISYKIRTYSESQLEANTWSSAMAKAEKIIFLGCHFHTQNLELLNTSNSVKTVYGTAFGRSKAAIEDISLLLERKFSAEKVYLENMESHKLFDEFDTRLLI
jgi:hypothetical protein